MANALNAALNPAIANAPQNAAIMDTIYDPIVGQITANLPAGVDLSDAATRGQVVDQVIDNFGDGLPSGGAGGSNLSGSLDGNTSFLNGADPNLTAPFLDGFANATVTVFWVAAVVVLVAFVLSFFLKAQPLREQFGAAGVARRPGQRGPGDRGPARREHRPGAQVAPDFDDEERDERSDADSERDPEPARR